MSRYPFAAPKIGTPSRRVWLALLTCLVALVGVGIISPAVYASAPGPQTPPSAQPSSANPVPGTGGFVQRSAAFLAEKQAFEVYSGLHAGSTKGSAQTAPYVIMKSRPFSGAPASYELSTNNPVPSTYEPSNGCLPNFGKNSSGHDDNGDNYCVWTQSMNSNYGIWGDQDFYNLCGPGAADVALWYWPSPPNLMQTWVTDTSPINPAITTYWAGYDTDNVHRMRGYLVYLAWLINWPYGTNLGHFGMMDDSKYPSYGTTLYGMADALNYEETGESSTSGFYIIQWWDSASQGLLNSEVMDDVYYSNVPIVAEVDASYLPNWAGAGRGIHHFITIIGYDNNAGIYYYTDTCGHTTNCNRQSAATDGGVHTVSQTTMWNAIHAIPVNKSTDPSAGDGGWVW